MQIQLPFGKMILLAGLFMLCLNACRKDIDKFTPYGDASSDIGALLSKIPDPNSSTDFMLQGQVADTILTTESGARIHYFDSENLFENVDGNPVPASICPTLHLRLTEIIGAADIIARSIPLSHNGILPDSITGLLRLEVFCGTTPLFIRAGKSIRIEVPAKNTFSKLFTYYADQNTAGAISGWQATNQEVFEASWPNPKGGLDLFGYDFTVTQTGLFGGFSFPQNNLGRMCLVMPEYYTAKNTRVFLFLKGGKTSFPLEFDSMAKQFCSEGVPVGVDADVFAFSKVGDQWQSASISTLTSNDLTLSMTQVNVEEAALLTTLRGF